MYNKALFLAVLVGGVALVIFGINASESRASDIPRFFTGSPTDRSMWILIGGSMLFVSGLCADQRQTHKGIGS